MRLMQCNSRLQYGIDQVPTSVARRFATVMVRATAVVDILELSRFVIVGATAAVGNIASVCLTRFFAPFEIALLVGIVAGLIISFVLSKFFAFGSRSWHCVSGEATRFLVVYALGGAAYWAAAVVSKRFALALGVAPRMAEIGGVLVGAGIMALMSYFGHRFFTYQTYQQAAERAGDAS
jgi:putative flippase GtrA